jgi:hypothetical protein
MNKFINLNLDPDRKKVLLLLYGGGEESYDLANAFAKNGDLDSYYVHRAI